MSEKITFHLDDDFHIVVGSKKTEVIVPRLKMKDAKKVLASVSRVVAEDNAKAIESIGAAARANSSISKEGFGDYAELIRRAVPALMESKYLAIVEQLLSDLSEGVLGGHVQDMQYEEAVKIVSFLLDKNFESLKNLSASLQAISSSAK